VSLIVAIQSAQPIKMHPNPSIASPGPALSSVITVVVMVSSPQMPVGPHLMPARPIPSLQDAQAVQVSVNATPLAPEPPRSLVVVVAPVQMPIGAHSAPMTLVVSVQGAETVLVHSNSSEPSPDPLVPTMKVMVVVVTTVEMPVTANVVPTSPIPTAEDTQAVPVPSDFFVMVGPEPS